MEIRASLGLMPDGAVGKRVEQMMRLQKCGSEDLCLQPLLDGQISCFRMRFQRRLFSCDSSIVTVMAASCAEFLMLPLPFVA